MKRSAIPFVSPIVAIGFFSITAYGQCPCSIPTNPYRMIGNGRQHKIVIDNSIPEFSQFKDNLDMAIADWQAVEFWNSQLPKIGDDGS